MKKSQVTAAKEGAKQKQGIEKDKSDKEFNPLASKTDKRSAGGDDDKSGEKKKRAKT